MINILLMRLMEYSMIPGLPGFGMAEKDGGVHRLCLGSRGCDKVKNNYQFRTRNFQSPILKMKNKEKI